MKKQLFILLMAMFAIGLSSTYGQTVTCPVPRVDVTCIPGDALHPAAGVPYSYVVDVPTPPGTREYLWFVTQDQHFINAGALTLAREVAPGPILLATGAGYNDPLTGTSTLSLTWNSFLYDPLAPVFVIIQVKNDAGLGGCITQNMKVFKIEPINAFTLDVVNVDAVGVAQAYDTPIDRCIHDIVDAIYDPTAPAPGGVIYDFGVDYLYFVVTAAKFSTSWRPYVQLTNVDPLETVTAVEWARPDDFAFATPHAMPLTGGVYESTDPVAVLDPSGTVGVNGECILIRVTVDHTNGANQYQGLTDETITFAVDGKTMLGAIPELGDVHYTGVQCGLEDGFDNDITLQTIKPRPDITAPTMPAPGLLPVR